MIKSDFYFFEYVVDSDLIVLARTTQEKEVACFDLPEARKLLYELQEAVNELERYELRVNG